MIIIILLYSIRLERKEDINYENLDIQVKMIQNTINTKLSSLMWVEKYRPKRIEEIVNQKDIIISLKNLVKKPNEIPHLLFAGPAGVGKTTTALCLSMELLGEGWKRDTLELNASDERGIKMVRERVKEFAAVIKLPSG
ncbi:MAG TPA: AAA family ATPase, partial [Nitrososphaeraceae archaeon]|nr:AAA family ATPase [Nitrososphaeraceae archaeon]